MLITLLGYNAHGQGQITSGTDGFTPSGLTVGAPAGSYPLSGFENVNPYNGALNFSLPLMQVGGRGGAHYTMQLPIEQRWRILRYIYPNGVAYVPDFNWWTGVTPRYGPGVLAGRAAGDWLAYYCPYTDSTTFYTTLTRLTFITPDGTEFELRDQATGGQPVQVEYCAWQGASRGTVFVSADGTAATFVSDTIIRDDLGGGETNLYPSGFLMLRDGTRYRIDQGNVTWMRDRNGNKLSFAYAGGQNGWATSVTDSLNRQVTFDYLTPTRPYDEIHFKGFGEASRTLRVWHANLGNALRSGFSLQSCNALFPGINATSGYCEPEVISEVTLPDGRSYKFRYNSYSELARVELPTGGAIEYDWAAGVNGGDASGMLGYEDVYRRVVERRVYSEGGGLQTRMTFSKPETEGPPTTFQNLGYVDVNHYDGTQLLTSERHYYQSVGAAQSMMYSSPVIYPGWNEFKEYRTETFDGNGMLLRRVEHTWQQGVIISPWNTSIPNNPRISDTTTTLEPGGANLVSRQTFGYDDSVPYNNQADVYEYGFGVGTWGTLTRRTHTNYLTASGYVDVSTGAHIRGLPTQTSIYNNVDIEQARATFEYDNYVTDTNHAALWNRSNTSGLDSAFTTSYTTRGNPTATTRYLLVNGSITGSVTAYAQYDIAGNMVKAIDARGNATTIDFADRFGTPDGEAESNPGPTNLNGQSSYAFPTRVTNAANQTTYTQFDYYLGRPVDGEDANGVVASGYSVNDLLDRPTRVIRAANQPSPIPGQTTFAYDDTNRIITTTTDQASFNDNTLKGQSVYDGLGRTIETRAYEGGDHYIAVQTQYDALGRAFKASNPFRPWKNETPVWTTSAFDALGRVISVTTPDGAVVSTAYDGDRILVTDQNGKQRISRTNALGQLTDVWEVTAPESGVTEGISFPGHTEVTAGYRTSYAYDTLGNLITVNQGSQPSFFGYDSLSRLLRARNSEQGVNANLPAFTEPVSGNSQWSMAYTYDNNGNLTQKTDARGVVSTYAYDALNRNTSVTYSNDPANTPAVTRTYDGATNGIGRPWKSQTNGDYGSLTTIDSYDSLGRPLIQRQQFYRAATQDWSASFSVERSYDLAGHVKTQTYPSGHSVSYNYDSAGRLADKDGEPAFSGNLGDGETRTYAAISGTITYDAASRLQQEQYGTLTPLYHKLHYNLRGQLYDMRLSTQSWQDAELDDDRGALINYYSAQNPGYTGTDNNGNLRRQETYIPGSDFFQQNYDYDELNRLKYVTEKVNGTGNDTFKQSYLYDRWGNRRIDTANTFGTGVNNLVYGVDAANNRLTAPAGYQALQYDGAGNLTQDPTSQNPTATSLYDAENRLSKISFPGSNQPIQYVYDADGRRVRRISAAQYIWQVYGMDGELLAEYYAGQFVVGVEQAVPVTNILFQKEYGYRSGQLLITASSGDDNRIDRFINNFYFAALGREPSATELSQQHAALILAAQQGQSQLLAAAQTFGQQLFDLEHSGSEYNQRNRSDEEFVTDLYFAYLQRSPDEGGMGYFLWQLQNCCTRIQVRDGFGASAEFAAITSTVYGVTPGIMIDRVAHYLSGMYLGVPGNAGNFGADLGTLQTAAAEGKGEVIQAAQIIGTNLFQAWVEDKNMSDEQFAAGLFHAFLQREPTQAEMAEWLHAVQGLGKAQAVEQFSNLTAAQELAGTLYREILWLTPDHLGTPRMISERSGSLAGIKRHDYLPFGEEIFSGTGARTAPQGYVDDNVRQQFTLKERDNETGLDYFINRYYSSTQGRFTSADPIPMTSQRPADPQRLNLYAYVRNNPLIYTDPNGLDLYFDLTFDANGKATNLDDAKKYKKYLQKASGLKLKLDERTGKITIKSEPNTLNPTAAQIKTIINDTVNAPVRIGASNNDPGVLVGQFNGGGHQTLDFADINKVSKKGGATKESIVVHETTEAYEGAKGSSYSAAHQVGIAYENDTRAGQGLQWRIGESASVSPNGQDVVIKVDYTTHIETITVDANNPGNIKSVKVEKKP